jgi:hypothetical protein
MVEKRLVPALRDAKISEKELLDIVREAEEYGHQHVFLYSTSPTYASGVVNDDTLTKSLTRLGRRELLTQPEIVDQPPAMKMTDARIEKGPYSRMMVLKAVETVTHSRPIAGTEDDGGRFYTKRFERIDTRAVHVLNFHSSGLIEMRVSAEDTTLTYSEKAEELWSFFAPIVDRLQCEDISIGKAQNAFWKGKRDEYRASIKYGDGRVRHTSGNTASFASGGENRSFFDDADARAGFDAFFGEDGVCDRSNIWFVLPSNAGKSGKVHVRFGGAINEFVIPASCDRKDYQYVLEQIRTANK